jgi:hypothetical protein
LLPLCRLRLRLGFIQVHFMLRWRRPDWFWHLTIFCLFPICQIPLLLEAAPKSEDLMLLSVPVPLNGNNLEAHLIVNPSGMRPASWLCLPLPYLRCQDTPSAPSLVLFLCPSSLSAFPSLGLPGPWLSMENVMPWYLLTYLSYSDT